MNISHVEWIIRGINHSHVEWITRGINHSQVEWITRGINHSNSRCKVKAQGVVSSLLVSQGTSARKTISHPLVKFRFLNRVHGDQAMHHRTEVMRLVHKTKTGDIIRVLVEVAGQVQAIKGEITEKEGGGNLYSIILYLFK